MKVKQKLALLSVFLGLVFGVSVFSYSPVVYAQQTTIPDGCPGSDVAGPPAPNVECPDPPEGDTEEEGTPPEDDEPACTPGQEGCCGGVKTSIIGGDICGSGEEDGSENGPIFNLLINTLRILTAGIGIAAVGGIAYGALLYTTAENKPEQTKKAIGIITNVVIGIVAYGLMFVLLNFLIPGGVITR